MASSSNMVCIILFTFTAKSKCSLSLTVFLLALSLAFDFIHSLPQLDNPTDLKARHCSGNNITNGSVLRGNLNVILNSLVDNVNKTGYIQTVHGQNADEIYGVAQCRGDLNASACRTCVSNATEDLGSLCNGIPNYASILLGGCSLRYATHSFYSKFNASDASHAVITLCDDIKINGTVGNTRDFKDWNVASLLRTLIEKTVSSNVGYSTLSDDGVYSLAQCWRAFTTSECNQCLNNMFTYLASCPLGTSRGIVCFDNCVICYANYKFYGDGAPLLSAPRETEGKHRLRVLVLSIGGAVVVVLVLLVVFWKRKVINLGNRKQGSGCYTPSGQLSTAISKSKLNYKFETLQTATKNFDPTNKIGQGGFGSIYKGVMVDGRQIAVKRLFSNREDSVSEFFNEVNLISGVQHKNLVKLLGCSVDGLQKLLVYEYLPNKSLDHFIFDKHMGNVLDWKRRFDIILGIASGLAYLHQESDIRIIHRDIKASNILLDHLFKPKIADFGLVRYFSEDQTHLSTGIVGTRGYMAPEYLVHGHLTEKVDVYAFGVLVLEIISGRRNQNPMHKNDIPSLLTMVWNYHLSGTVSNINDPNIQENYQQEVLHVIHIALLCTQASAALRPSMSEVIVFLTSKDQNLLEPSPPPFIDCIHLQNNVGSNVASNHSRSNTNTSISPTSKAHDLVSKIASSSSLPMTFNTISMSSFGPR